MHRYYFLPGSKFLLILLCCGTALSGRGQTTNPSQSRYRIKSVYLPREKRPEVRYTKSQLPFKEIGGELPSFDGAGFSLTMTHENIRDTAGARTMLSRFFGSLGSPLKVGDNIRLDVNAVTVAPNQKFVEQQIRMAEDSMEKRLSGKYKKVSDSTNSFMKSYSNDLRSQANSKVTVYRYNQYLDQTVIDNTGVVVLNRVENNVVSVQGKFYNTVNITNTKTLSFNSALQKAIRYIEDSNQFKGIKTQANTSKMVLLPYSDGFKYAWKTVITADGPYQVWIDAQTGQVLQLLPNFFFDSGKGIVFNPDPSKGTKMVSFEVDPPKGGKYTLNDAGVLTLSNRSGDGTSVILTITDDGSGSANFDVSPINGTTVDRTSQSGYNGLFQQVNIYGWIFTERKYYMSLGSQDFGQVNVTFNNSGGNSFCCPPTFYTGTATVSSSTSCIDEFNAGIDATVISHEFGHNLNGIQYAVTGGRMTQSLNEGMADWWAYTNCDTNTFGGWWAKNCSAPTQGSFVPRQADPLDIFPSHKNLADASTDPHSQGQIIAWANWSSRQGMNDATSLGTFMINFELIKAMTTAGVGINNTTRDQDVHDSYLDLLRQTAPLFNTSRLIHKLLAGYARAGIFLAAQDAIIDIDHSYLDRSSSTGPVFSIWTGEDYTFDNAGNAVTSSPPYNTQFLVEVANDEAFRSNLVSSGWQTGVSGGDGGHATWTLPAAVWDKLKAGDAIYYRVTTKDKSGKIIRQSGNPGNGFLTNVPVGKAAINDTGTQDCACSATTQGKNSSMALLPLVPLGLLAVWRKRVKRFMYNETTIS